MLQALIDSCLNANPATCLAALQALREVVQAKPGLVEHQPIVLQTLIDSCLNANPATCLAALQALREVVQAKPRLVEHQPIVRNLIDGCLNANPAICFTALRVLREVVQVNPGLVEHQPTLFKALINKYLNALDATEEIRLTALKALREIGKDLLAWVKIEHEQATLTSLLNNCLDDHAAIRQAAHRALESVVQANPGLVHELIERLITCAPREDNPANLPIFEQLLEKSGALVAKAMVTQTHKRLKTINKEQHWRAGSITSLSEEANRRMVQAAPMMVVKQIKERMVAAKIPRSLHR